MVDGRVNVVGDATLKRLPCDDPGFSGLPSVKESIVLKGFVTPASDSVYAPGQVIPDEQNLHLFKGINTAYYHRKEGRKQLARLSPIASTRLFSQTQTFQMDSFTISPATLAAAESNFTAPAKVAKSFKSSIIPLCLTQ
ncbi:hypothetical protein DACRYDRAFT_107749 [Dacryopinax primogenitus]|uniref:Uncharacterized protein n=1 Tax=Dacryopinax primogenitus (strain DJM 731) TaxID=1858805 RepID=M5FZT8_DACPD|nr:uncharacterized protein DACRYDRAFT_107749 [Dacryopinax primogenitus]EJU02029.1 hypothetical protein DACRYDRAFT_107749 [Dacryopinax primogenitus]